MKYPLERLNQVVDNPYALIEILSKRSNDIRYQDSSRLVSSAIDQAIDELLDDTLKFYNYK